MPLNIDFLSPKLQYRRKHASLRNEAIARAIGLKPKDHPLLVDATAGLANDSFILAALGFELILLERSPILYPLLQSALQNASQDSEVAPIIKRLHLIQADAIHWLTYCHPQPDVILLDPMFPKRSKSAKTRQTFLLLCDLIGKDEDADILFHQARACALKRVVVKRPRRAKPLANFKPSFQLIGKSARFDIYLTGKN